MFETVLNVYFITCDIYFRIFLLLKNKIKIFYNNMARFHKQALSLSQDYALVK